MKTHFTPAPWGIEQTDEKNWIGTMRQDGKVEDIICYTDREELKPEALERNDANAALIAVAPQMFDIINRILAVGALERIECFDLFHEARSVCKKALGNPEKV